MGPEQDVMERLAAADPAPGAVHLTASEQSEADALLARVLAERLAEAVPERPAPRLRRRHWLLVAAAAACSALAAVAAIDSLDSDPRGPGVVAKAVAAVSQKDAVYHVVRRTRIPASFPRPRVLIFESWRTTDGRMHEKIFRVKGGRRASPIFEIAGRRRLGRTAGPALKYDPVMTNTITRSGFGPAPAAADAPIDPYADPGIRLRVLQRQGRLRLTGTTSVDGRRAYRLGSQPVVKGRERERVEFLVDAETYLPLAETRWWRVGDRPTYRFTSRYLVYERLPLTARTRATLALDPPPGAKCASGAGELSSERAGFPQPLLAAATASSRVGKNSIRTSLPPATAQSISPFWAVSIPLARPRAVNRSDPTTCPPLNSSRSSTSTAIRSITS